jgi:diadenosine tetraphosphate (Ap4A) HIT family hydrolase
MNATIERFGYPSTLLTESASWVVLLRPQQVTLGSMVLACKLESTRFSELPADCFAELSVMTAAIEGALKKTFSYDKINYLALMMVDKHVHFHVLPRYETKREFFGVEFVDKSWPKPPDLGQVVNLTEEAFKELHRLLKGLPK